MNAPSRPRRRHALAMGSCLLAAALTLTACGGKSDKSSDASGSGGQSVKADPGAFPVTVKTAFGSATVKSAPKRVVALGWSDQDAALALGVKPVAIVKTEDGFKNGVGPWAESALGSSRPEVLDTTDGYPVEKIAALHPDLILAVQSGITASDYAKLSQIAPTVAYLPGRKPYGTPWQEQTDLIGKVLGRQKEADQDVATVEKGLKQDATTYPSLKGKSFVYAFPQAANGRVVLYTDDRTKVLEEVGLKIDPVVAKAAKMNSFANSLSMEHLDELTSDALLVWYNTPQDQKQLESNAVFEKLPAVQKKAYVAVDRTLAQASSAPSVLSIPWEMGKLLPPLAQALKK
ncbi:iron-siderophore ABC transporter substrate-binding protein [Streptomyces sp. PTM05]|uniref:Iron-siderophore ABC transporter substrate-binding protein n=1 Tax=Streptantibioticus parmotrematis TaxID=2873249 RepID=A0ABS7QNB6_9ACTN|nr:iron-siderophore ABC transporter substrate-binding protein [Streptantibioticus parmotrematis]MBY8883352.1 iron-siderophore ABC transporter substrate-binding protein [Streptantibioticus parmotrematis]